MAILRGSKFWCATLILGVYSLLVTLPDLLVSFLAFKITDPESTAMMFRIARMLFVASNAADAVIYAFLTPTVKTSLLRKFQKARKRRDEIPGLPKRPANSH